MFKTLYRCPRTITRHENRPLYESRRKYLEHLAAQGSSLKTMRVAAEVINDALADFRDAVERAMGNLRARAICLLRMAEIYAKNHNSRLAAQCFEEWRQISPQVSNAYLRRLESTAQSSIDAISSDFVVRLTDDHLDPVDLERGLHGFLARWAAPRTKSDQKAADLLGISRQTLLNWRSDDEKSA